MTVKTELDKLQKHDRDALLYAFEQGDSLYFPIGDGFVVGVNPDASPHVTVVLKEGYWYVGMLAIKE